MNIDSAEMGIYNSFRLPDHCSVYQAKVTSIQEARMHIELIKPNTRDIFREIVHFQIALKFAYLKAMSYQFCCMVQAL